MKFTITFKSNKEIKGVNTLHMVQSWLYQNLERVNSEKAKWLHDQGYFVDKKTMKPINFSPLYKTKNAHYYGIKLSSLDREILQMIHAMLVDPMPLFINDTKLEVTDIKIKRFTPWKYGTKFFTLSPIILKDKKGIVKLNMQNSADIDKARKIIEDNLAWKYKALYGEEPKDGIDYFIPKKVNSIFYTSYQLNTGKKIPLTGYTGEFILQGDFDLIRIAYYCGIGAKTACGFGCVEQVSVI